MSTTHTFPIKQLLRIDADQAARMCAADCDATKTGYVVCKEMATGWIVSVFMDAKDDDSLSDPDHRYQISTRGKMRKLKSR
jgi:hypothetical protein